MPHCCSDYYYTTLALLPLVVFLNATNEAAHVKRTKQECALLRFQELPVEGIWLRLTYDSGIIIATACIMVQARQTVKRGTHHCPYRK